MLFPNISGTARRCIGVLVLLPIIVAVFFDARIASIVIALIAVGMAYEFGKMVTMPMLAKLTLCLCIILQALPIWVVDLGLWWHAGMPPQAQINHPDRQCLQNDAETKRQFGQHRHCDHFAKFIGHANRNERDHNAGNPRVEENSYNDWQQYQYPNATPRCTRYVWKQHIVNHSQQHEADACHHTGRHQNGVAAAQTNPTPQKSPWC